MHLAIYKTIHILRGKLFVQFYQGAALPHFLLRIVSRKFIKLSCKLLGRLIMIVGKCPLNHDHSQDNLVFGKGY